MIKSPATRLGIERNMAMDNSSNNGKRGNPRPHKGNSLVAFPSDYIVVDLETTGLSPEWDEILEIAALKVSGGVVVDTFQSFAKPSEPIDEFIAQLTGITDEMVATAPGVEDVLPNLFAFVGNSVVVGHNVNFDINFLYDNSARLLGVPFGNDYIDTMRLSRLLLPGLPHYRLKDMVKHYGIAAAGYHQALSDCELTRNVFECLRQTAAEQFGSPEHFIIRRICHHLADNSKITTHNTQFDETHPLFGKVCVFTGTLDRLVRKEAKQLVVDLGGICSGTVTKDTNYLILGNTQYCTTIKGGKSTKHKKAEAYKLKGCEIEIIPENVFYDMLETPSAVSGSVVLPSAAQLSPEEEALEILKGIIPGEFTTEHRSDDYLTLLSPSGNDFCRIKFTKRAAWFSLDCWSGGNIKDDPLLAGVKNKNQRHWKINISGPSDLHTYAHIIAAVYNS